MATRKPARLRAEPLLIALLLGALALAALSAAARAETGAPALEGDGVWRARGDWTVQGGDKVVHDGHPVEVFGNLTLEANASLAFSNATLTFPNGTAASHNLSLAEGAVFTLVNATLSARGVNDTVDILQGTLEAAQCSLLLSQAPSPGPSIRARDSHLALGDCVVETGAALVVEARDSVFGAQNTEFRSPSGAPPAVLITGAGTYTFDTVSWGDLRAEGGPPFVAFASVRFKVLDSAGSEVAAHVNGTGAFGELFSADVQPNTTAPLRFKWLDLAQAPALLAAADRRSPSPVRFNAYAAGAGGNTSEFFIDGARENVTVVLAHTYDLAITSFTVIGKALSGPSLKRAYYLDMNASIDLLLHLENKGVEPSPAATLVITQLALDPSSWTPQGSREERTVEVRSLLPGEGINTSFGFVPAPYGGKVDSSGPCFTSLSYTSGLRAALVVNASADFAPWNDERAFTLIAFDVHGSSAPECRSKGGDFLPWLAAGAGAAIAAVAFITYRSSDRQMARRAALKAAEPPRQPPNPPAPPPP